MNNRPLDGATAPVALETLDWWYKPSPTTLETQVTECGA
jgi:hypothetical protein